jgi:hypothetical protein
MMMVFVGGIVSPGGVLVKRLWKVQAAALCEALSHAACDSSNSSSREEKQQELKQEQQHLKRPSL